MWKTSPKKVLFHVTLETFDGNRRKAWILVGNSVLGLWARDIEVRWEK